jgi:hypothetical protein
MKEVLNSYFADNDTPLLISFANHLKDWGYSVEIDYDNWDLLAYKESDEPDIAVLTVNKSLRPNQIRNIAQGEGPSKVVLVEGDDLELDDKIAMKLFMAQINVALYFRNLGWVSYTDEHRKLGFRDWNYRLLRHYRQDEDGTWNKACYGCGAFQPLTEYYRRPFSQGTARDPYRNLCKTCWNDRYRKKVDKPRISVV